MTSRRRQQDARRQQRTQRISYGQALRNMRGQQPGGPPGPPGSGGPTGFGGSQVPPPPSWDTGRFTEAENAAIGRVAGLHGDALPAEAVDRIARHLGLPGYDGDLVARRVALKPGPFHDVSSDVTSTYDYGLEVHEVVVPFTADIEITVSSAEATSLLANGATLLIPDATEPTLLVSNISVIFYAQVRLEFEHVEIMEEVYDPE